MFFCFKLFSCTYTRQYKYILFRSLLNLTRMPTRCRSSWRNAKRSFVFDSSRSHHSSRSIKFNSIGEILYFSEFERNFEAQELSECGGGITIDNALDLEKILTHFFNNEDELKQRGGAAKNYVYSNAGATKKIMEYTQEKRLLTN